MEENSIVPEGVASPYRLSLVTPYSGLATMVARLAPDYGCRLQVLEAVFDEARDIAPQAMAAAPEGLLRRGATADRLRLAVGDVPVVRIADSPLDLMGLLRPFAGSIGHVAFFRFAAAMHGVADVAQALAMRIDEYVFHSQ
jgi:hypothetical protein